MTGRGDVNTYALFAELFSQSDRPGRASRCYRADRNRDRRDDGFLLRRIDRQARLATLIDFENRNAIFPAVHRSYKFCLLTIGSNVGGARFSFFLTDVAQLAEPERHFTLSPKQIAAINPNTKTAPVFRSRADAELAAKIYSRVPVLIDETKGTGGQSLGRVLFGDVPHVQRQRSVPHSSTIARGRVRAGRSRLGQARARRAARCASTPWRTRRHGAGPSRWLIACGRAPCATI